MKEKKKRSSPLKAPKSRVKVKLSYDLRIPTEGWSLGNQGIVTENSKKKGKNNFFKLMEKNIVFIVLWRKLQY